MEMKCIEIRDEGTCIPALAVRMISTDLITDKYLWRCGYPRGVMHPTIVLMRLMDQEAHSDPYDWGSNTMRWAHKELLENWEKYSNGKVLDVRTVRDPSIPPATPEIWP